jgi:nucleoside-diphosphate-sugar epimerase
MRVIVTGAAGFVGRSLVARLRQNHDVVATDRRLPPNIDGIAGDLSEPGFAERLVAGGCQALIHLATIPGGAAEQDPDLAWRVNVDATRRLVDAVVAGGPGARFVYASSIAVFGEPLPTAIDDESEIAPRLLYGGHKAVAESWLATQSRRGALDAISLRLPGIVARPRDGAGLKSAFMSDLFHSIAAGEPFTLPVSGAATVWLMSVRCCARNLAHGILAEGQMPDSRALTLPAIRTTMAELVASIGRHTGRVPQIDYAPDEALEAAFGRLPLLTTRVADALGFVHDGDLDTLVANALGD